VDCGSGVSNLVIRAKRVISLVGVMIAWHMILIKYSLHCSFSALGRCAVRGLHVGFEREGVVRWMGDEGLGGLICGEDR
jgi:hypothetical protein